MSLTLSIDSIAYRGPGIGRAEGCVVFVPPSGSIACDRNANPEPVFRGAFRFSRRAG